jgi:molybdopterin/thiamine biosynthesis adenylyltransferase
VTLAPGELERYSRQLLLPGWDEATQERLRRASVLVIGAGALGSVALQYLAAAGVGRLGIVDDDEVELSNLARQVLHYTPDVGVPKSASAASKLRYLNPSIVVDDYAARLGPANAAALLVGQDLVIDCTDSFASRYAVNDACIVEGAPLVVGTALGYAGTVMTVLPSETACWRCAFPRAPDPATAPSCATAGMLGPVAGIVGSFQATEAIKLLTRIGEPLTDRFLEIDALSGSVQVVSTSRDPQCRACGAE